MTSPTSKHAAGIRRLVGKLKGRSLREIRDRVEQTLSAQLEYRLPFLFARAPDDEALFTTDELAELSREGDLVTALHRRLTMRHSPGFFPGLRDGANASSLRGERWADARAQLLARADSVLAGRYDLLGRTALSWGSPIDWHLDPISGRRAPRLHWSRIPYLDPAQVGDHKVVWEINRHQHFYVLGRAYQLTGRTAYAECFADQVSAWMDANPPAIGVNWASSLELAYRSIAWLWAIELFRGSSALSAPLLRRMVGFLHLQGSHVERHLSTFFSPNTHLTGEALGLFYLGTMLPELRDAERWRRRGWEILERELPKQIHRDGVYFEQASYYHRYTADIYLHALLLAGATGITIPSGMRDRLGTAIEHLADLSRPDGSIAFTGDDDGGRLAHLDERVAEDVRSVLAVGSVLLQRPELAVVAGGATEESVWLLGAEQARQIDQQRLGTSPVHLSRLYADGGVAIMRDSWGPQAMHAVIDSGPLGAMNCGHAHSDALSVVLTAGATPILVDPGTYSYTTSVTDRDYFRHSATHNTVTIDDQSAAVPLGPFSWEHRVDARTEKWWAGALVDRLVASHPGFERLADPALHRREVVFVHGDYWVIVDTVLSEGEHEVAAHFHLPAGAEIESICGLSSTVELPGRSGSARVLLAMGGDVQSVEWSEGWQSPVYGSRVRAPHARAISRRRGRHQLIAVVAPMAVGASVSVSRLSADGGMALLIDRSTAADLVLTSSGGEMTAAEVTLRGEMAILRRDTRTGKLTNVALFGPDATLRVEGLTFSTPAAAEWTVELGSWTVRGDGGIRLD